MRGVFWCILALLFIALGLLSFPGSVYGDTSVTITVTAEVEPTAYIIVNGSHKVQEIISNDSKPTHFFSYLNSLRGQPVALTGNIVSQYDQITNNGVNCHDGVVYSAPESNQPATNNKIIEFKEISLVKKSLTNFSIASYR